MGLKKESFRKLFGHHWRLFNLHKEGLFNYDKGIKDIVSETDAHKMLSSVEGMRSALESLESDIKSHYPNIRKNSQSDKQ